ncbi:5b1ddec9-1811-475f-8a14-dded56fccdcd [Sclerotinia trifoliorum]|uniref:5b1ddec9-1811-475f-8a14-dded56fccdcd n=1 Tax=Sclerotinia trifoliorum TaxID=28548 RepID=A0A8H2VNB3_9HELO|nr:5b1ddec9-1811-475f-8a14-dded56fccdcd [Sclerotinia trifoliorum]
MTSNSSNEHDKTPLLENKPLQHYYASLESRIGYRLVLGGTRHFGFYPAGTTWPFPIRKALHAMEDHLIANLALESGSKVLDAGCGVGHVAMHLAKTAGFNIHAIDVVDHHLMKARRNVNADGLEGQITISKEDYHHLDAFKDGEFDGVYTMETFVHAVEPEIAAKEFLRILRPGGKLAMYEYDHVDFTTQTKDIGASFTRINTHAAMPAHERFNQGVLEKILEEAGFEDVVVKDLSDNVLPMLRMFYLLAFIPYFVISFLGLQSYFINTVAGYKGYVYRNTSRYIAVSARKPLDGGK